MDVVAGRQIETLDLRVQGLVDLVIRSGETVACDIQGHDQREEAEHDAAVGDGRPGTITRQLHDDYWQAHDDPAWSCAVF